MTSLYATAQTSTASEVSNTSSSAIAAAAAANAVAATTTADPSKTYPLAEEAFLTEATSESSTPPTTPQQPQQYTKRTSAPMTNGSANKKSQCSQQCTWLPPTHETHC